MTKKNIQCSLAGLGGAWWHCWLRDVTGSMVLRALEVTGSGRMMALRLEDRAGHQCRGLENGVGCTMSRARGWRCCCRLRNNVVGLGMWPAWSIASPTQVGKITAHKGPGSGREWWCGGFREDSTMAQRLRGGLDDGTGSGKVDDSMGSRENFGRKFW
jgi:hypothetical protein